MCHRSIPARQPGRPAAHSGWIGVVLTVAVLAGSAACASARAEDGPADGLPVMAAGHLDAQLADLDTPAFVDGLAGLLLVHAGRNPDRAGAIGRTVLARAPGARGQVAEALRLAGFDPAVAGLESAPARTRAPVGDDVSGGGVADGGFARPGMALVQGATGSSGGGSAPAGRGGGGGGLGGVSLNLSAGQTARPGLADLATPQLR